MISVGENPTKMDDDWGYPYLRKPPFMKDYLWLIGIRHEIDNYGCKMMLKISMDYVSMIVV